MRCWCTIAIVTIAIVNAFYCFWYKSIVIKVQNTIFENRITWNDSGPVYNGYVSVNLNCQRIPIWANISIKYLLNILYRLTPHSVCLYCSPICIFASRKQIERTVDKLNHLLVLEKKKNTKNSTKFVDRQPRTIHKRIHHTFTFIHHTHTYAWSWSVVKSEPAIEVVRALYVPRSFIEYCAENETRNRIGGEKNVNTCKNSHQFNSQSFDKHTDYSLLNNSALALEDNRSIALFGRMGRIHSIYQDARQKMLSFSLVYFLSSASYSRMA